MLPGRTTLVFILVVPLGMSQKCSHTTNTTEWTVSAVCVNMFVRSPDTCQWDVISRTDNHRLESPVTSPSYQRFFYCSGTFRLPLTTGEYSYRILLPVNNWQIAFDLRIDDPGEPTVNGCPIEVGEGDNVTCTCRTQREGSPPPVITWAGHTPSPTLHLYGVTREHKPYTCETMWGNQTKTVSYSLLVRSVKNKENSISSLPFEIIGAVAAALMVIILVTAVIGIFIIRRKRILSQNIPSSSGDNIDELIDNSYYGGLPLKATEQSEMAEEDYAEVTGWHEGESTESFLSANAGTNVKRQTENLTLYANMETNELRNTPQVDLNISVDKSGEKQVQSEFNVLLGELHYKGDNSTSLRGNYFAGEEDTYAVIDEDPDSHAQT